MKNAHTCYTISTCERMLKIFYETEKNKKVKIQTSYGNR